MWKVLLFGGILILGICSVTSQREMPRCFSFTWLGPSFHNGSEFMNATCSEVTRLASGVPCFHPLVVSYDGSRPDVEYIWKNHAAQASCVLTDTDVCATYTYFFNGLVMNVTQMCTRVEESSGRRITGGCYQSTNGNYRTEACFCRSVPGGFPCNDSVVNTAPLLLLLVAVVTVVVKLNNLSYG